MAASKQGQNAMICQLCEEIFEVEWKCLICEFFMCTKCCKIHEKFKSSDRHDNVNIKDDLTIKEAVRKDFSEIKCKLHKAQSCSLFCQNCEELVCFLCVNKMHSTHKMLESAECHEFMLNKIKTRKTEIEKEHEYKSSYIKSLREREISIHETERTKILDHSKVLKEAVDEQIGKLLNDLDYNRNKQELYFEKEERRLELERQEKKKRIEMLIASNSSEYLDVIIKNFNTEKEITTEQTSFQNFPKLPSFDAEDREETTANIVSACGIMYQTKLNFAIERAIYLNHNTNNIYNILVDDEKSVWLNNNSSSVLFKLDPPETCENATIRNRFDIRVFDMAKTKDGDLLLSTQKPELRMIQKTKGQILKSYIRLYEGFVTTAVHVTHDDKILVGATRYTDNRSLVRTVNENEDRIYKLDKYNRRLFTFPVRITSDDNNNINVIDTPDQDRNDGRIVMLSQRGEIRGVYSGHPMLNEEITFKPFTMVSTKFDTIIVSEIENHMLHILNTKGQCIQYQDTRDLGFAFPCAMDIDGDVLLICAKSAGKYTKDKIVAVKLS